MKKSWLFPTLAGLLFGIFDFYFQIWINQLLSAGRLSAVAMQIPILGVWMLLVAPLAIREALASGSLWRSALISALAWSAAVISYYSYMGVVLILIGQSSRPEMHISQRNDGVYWSNIKNFLLGDVLGGVSEWIPIALIGGSLVGLGIGILCLQLKKVTTNGFQFRR